MRDDLRGLLVEGARELGVPLDDVAVGRFSEYLELLRSWGRRMNLTTRLLEDEVVTHHFLDSLSAAPLIRPRTGARLVDIGSGAGFPGLPLKIACPELDVVLVDSVRKKVSFCRQVIRETALTGIRVEVGRAEDLAADPSLAGSFRWATARAVDEAARIAEIAFPFLDPLGTALIYKGRPGERELSGLREACSRMGLEAESRALRVPGLDATRTILVVRRAPG